MARAPRQMLAAAAACVAAFSLVMALVYGPGAAQWVDGAALNGFVATSDRPIVAHVADVIAFLCNPLPYTALCLPLFAYAYFKWGPRRAAAVALLLGGANVSSQVLKPLLAQPRSLAEWSDVHPIAAGAFPSGHATAAMALAFGAVLVVPRAYRPIAAAVGGVFALAVSISVLVLNWHWPSDVVAGQLLAATWCFVALAALRYADTRWPEHGSMRRAAREAFVLPRARTVVTAGVGLLAVLAPAAAWKAAAMVHFADVHTTALAAGALIAASAAALLGGVTTVAVRR